MAELDLAGEIQWPPAPWLELAGRGCREVTYGPDLFRCGLGIVVAALARRLPIVRTLRASTAVCLRDRRDGRTDVRSGGCDYTCNDQGCTCVTA